MYYNYLFRYVIIINTWVRKTCLLLQFTDSYFCNDFDPVISVEFRLKQPRSRKKYYLEICDTTEELYEGIRQRTAIVVFTSHIAHRRYLSGRKRGGRSNEKCNLIDHWSYSQEGISTSKIYLLKIAKENGLLILTLQLRLEVWQFISLTIV